MRPWLPLLCALVTASCREILDLEDKTACERDSDCRAGCLDMSCVEHVCVAAGRAEVGTACGSDGLGQCNEAAACMAEDVALASNNRHTCALMHDGALFCWGDNEFGQLGDGTQERRLHPARIELPPVASVSTGYGHTCSATMQGDVYCWGNNQGLQVGTGGEPLGPPQLTPFRVPNISGIRSVTAGYGHSCALDRDGAVYCWGYNGFGQCAAPASMLTIAVPRRVAGLRTVAKLVAIKNHTCALQSDGELLCWGDNKLGETGVPEATMVETPSVVNVALPDDAGASPRVRDIGLSFASSCALRTDQHVVCWGQNEFGQLGNGELDAAGNAKPVLVLVAERNAALEDGGSLISTSASFACVRHEISLFFECWGTTWPGQLGADLPLNAQARFPDQHLSSMAELAGLPRDVMSVAFGDQHGCAVYTGAEPTIRCFGHRQHAGLGDAEPTWQLTPAPIAWKAD